MNELQSRFGNVCPLWKLSQHYGEDYTAVLQYADSVVHGRGPIGVNLIGTIGVNGDYGAVTTEIRTIAYWMKEQHHEAERLEAAGRLVFDMTKGKWVQLD